jgi:hypothetical protein
MDRARMSTPFDALNLVCGWWQLRPSDKGDGHGYSGMTLTVKAVTADTTSFQGDDLDDLIIDATVWCQQFTKLPQQTSKTKRVIPRA